MKTRYIIGFLILIIALIGLFYYYSPEDQGQVVEDEKTPVYVTIYSHNEDSWGPIVNTPQRYKEYRANLLERLHIIHDYNATLNWQSDITVLQAMIEHEEGSDKEETNGKNILRYMVEDLGFSVDPHGHLVEANYADLVYLIEQLGIDSSGVIGGVRVFDYGSEYKEILDHLDWHDILEIQEDGYIYGRMYQSERWKPNILSGPAVAGHGYDDFSSGVWRPGNEEEFYTPQEEGIIYVGQGYPHDESNLGPREEMKVKVFASKGVYIKELVEKIQDGELPSDQMYTASIHVRDNSIVKLGDVEHNVNDGLVEILTELKPLVDQGQIRYVTYQEAARIWKQDYGEDPNIVDIENFSMYQEIIEQATSISNRQRDDTSKIKPAIYDDETFKVDIRIPSQAALDEGIMLRIIFPKDSENTKYNEGSPIVVFVQGGRDEAVSVSPFKKTSVSTGYGLTQIYFNLPGTGESPFRSGGEYDNRGMNCIIALRDVIKFALGKIPDEKGVLIKEYVPFVDTNNLGILASSNGGNLAVVTLDLYGEELEGVKYYVGFENPAGDEFVNVDLGGVGKTNPAYVPGSTVLDPVKGSLTEINMSLMKHDLKSGVLFHDTDNNGIYDPVIDYKYSAWEHAGAKYYSTEITSAVQTKGLLDFATNEVAGLQESVNFWYLRDMSRHYAGMDNLKTLKGAIIIGRKQDHVQFTSDYPHLKINYQGWRITPFARLNPDKEYLHYVLSQAGIESNYSLTDNHANIEIESIQQNLLEPNINSIHIITASILEMVDRVYLNNWEENLVNIIMKKS